MGAVAGATQTRAVSIGGGTGQPNAIRALRGAGCSVSAIVAMADDGGSTGLLREKMGLNPPGDIRKCLVAMADDPESPLARAFEHRLGFSDNHTLGNLLIAALTEETGSFVEAVSLCNRMLGCHGRVLASTLDDVVLCGTTRDGLEFRGEATLGTGPCALSRVWLSPRRPEAYGPAVEAITLDADIVVLGPGSLFTSVIPNLLVPGILDALKRTQAPKVYVCSMADMQGESWGLNAEEYVDALLSHGLEGHLDAVLIHRPPSRGPAWRPVAFRRSPRNRCAGTPRCGRRGVRRPGRRRPSASGTSGPCRSTTGGSPGSRPGCPSSWCATSATQSSPRGTASPSSRRSCGGSIGARVLHGNGTTTSSRAWRGRAPASPSQLAAMVRVCGTLSGARGSAASSCRFPPRPARWPARS